MNEQIRRILVASDGSPESEGVFAAAMPFVRKDDPEVSVLHVLEGPEESFTPPARVAKACRVLRTFGVKAHLEIREGKPAEEILRLSKERGIDLVVLSTHGRRGIRRVLMGSVTEEVLRRSESPVLVTRPGLTAGDWTRIVVPLDGSPRGEAILEEVVPLARKFRTSVELVRAAMPPVTMSGLGEIPGPVLRDDPMPYLLQVQKRLRSMGVEASVTGLEGRAASEIVRHAAEGQAALLCLSTHGRSGFARVLLGSVAEDVVRNAPCPVLLRRSLPAATGPEPVPISGEVAPGFP